MTALRLARLDIEAAQERLPAAVHLIGAAAPAREVHSHSGFGAAVAGQVIDGSRMRVPSMTGSSPSWSSQAPRACQPLVQPVPGRAAAVPYRVVSVVVVTAGAGQAAGPRA